ncbi:MAG: hypothetical protein N3B21_08760 [Clostridia bacterium]|nr:hypothetical protein [Clostridia bacterium]
MEANPRDLNGIVNNLIVQPFPILFNRNDYHVMLYLKDHPEYESIEAMIRECSSGKPYIRAIITLHDQSQIDHINAAETVIALESRNEPRKTVYSPMRYERSQKNGKPYIHIKFTSFRGENIIFDFYAVSKASTKYAGLTDPGEHSIDTSLPIMYREKSTLASPKSCIAIDGIKYRTPKKIWIPLIFKGMKGFYSENFRMGVIRNFVEKVNISSAPSTLAPGEKWIYLSGKQKTEYKIKDVKGNMLTIVGDNKMINAEVTDKNISIANLTVLSSSNTSSDSLSLEFTPPLPISNPCLDSLEKGVGFSIYLSDSEPLVTGIVKVESASNILKFILTPVLPKWAAKRSVCTSIEAIDGAFVIKTGIGSY